MSSITATADQTYGAVKIFLDFSAVAATGVAGAYGQVTLYRVTPDGQQVAVRNSPVWTSAGQAVFIDNEAPLSTTLTYNAVMPSGAQVVADTFARITSNGWGVATSGQTWTTSGGAASDYATTGTTGTHTHTSVGVPRLTVLAAVSLTDVDITYTTSTPVVALTQPIDVSAMARYANASNHYIAGVRFLMGGTLLAYIASNVAGVVTNLAVVSTGLSYSGGTQVKVRTQVIGAVIRTKIWLASSPEPAAWSASVIDTSLTAAGGVGIRSVLITGNTNTTPVTLSVSSFNANNLQSVTLSSNSVIITGSGLAAGQTEIGWVKDPWSSATDVPLNFYLHQTSECATGTGVAVTDFDTMTYVDRASEFPIIGAANPNVVAMMRASGSSTLIFTTLTLTDFLLLRNVFAPGRVLLVQVPTSYGWGLDYYGNEYVHVKNVDVGRGQVQNYHHQQRVWSVEVQIVGAPVDIADGLIGSNGIGVGRSTYGIMKASGLTNLQLKNAAVTYAQLALGQGF